MKSPFITIGIASYNYSQYLKKAFEMIKKQSFLNYEILYIDDCSKDNSVEIIQGFIRDNPQMKIKLIEHKENKGLLETKSDILRVANGRYVMLCDADDWMAEDCLEMLADAAMSSNADRVISQVASLDEKEQIIQIQDFPAYPSKWLWNIHHGCLYKTTLLKEHNIKLELVPDDVYLTTTYNIYSRREIWVRKTLYYWRVHEDSEGRKKADSKKSLKEFEKIAKYILNVAGQQKGQEVIEQIRLLSIKLYYLYIFQIVKKYSLTEKEKYYRQLNKCMKEIYPDYLYNQLFRKKKKAPARKYAMNIMKMGSTIERLHLMPIALVFYHMLVGMGVVFEQ